MGRSGGKPDPDATEAEAIAEELPFAYAAGLVDRAAIACFAVQDRAEVEQPWMLSSQRTISRQVQAAAEAPSPNSMTSWASAQCRVPPVSAK
mmetsp:Transcript_28332/g.61848  ORF Transcript_28332/g.61848 Transcript_28332/m.61848 type:complete len:92 (+) Transcript_28332:1304-1579(+)